MSSLGDPRPRREDVELRLERTEEGFIGGGPNLGRAASPTPAGIVVALAGTLEAEWAGRRQAAADSRLRLHVDDRTAGVWWEPLLRPHWRGPIVRTSPTVPTIANLPLTTPIRVLEVASEPRLDDLLAVVAAEAGQLGTNGPLLAADAIDVDHLPGYPSALAWPTVEVLHFGPEAVPEGWSTRTTDAPGRGTVAWLERLARGWQTRLVVLETTDGGLQQALLVAHRLADRGGPGVVVRRPGADPPAELYRGLLAGAPLDLFLDESAGLFGAGREGLLQLPRTGDELAQRWERPVPRMEGVARRSDVADEWLIRRRENPEPPVEDLSWLSQQLDVLRLERAAPAHPDVSGRRFVNADLQLADADGLSRQVTTGEILQARDVVHLKVWIGPHALDLRALRSRALVDEVLRWGPDHEGAWLTVAVTGVDFDVDGSREQPLWLPRQGPSHPCFFAIRPRALPLAFLRFTLFQGQSAVQSFRLAARIQGSGDGPAGEDDLARALGVDSWEITGRGWATRLDFALTPELGTAVEELPPRALTIVANDLGGRTVVSVKAEELFDARVDPDTPQYVALTRTALENTSEQAGHSYYGNSNDGTPEALKNALRTVAEAGATLYGKVIPPTARKHVGRVLAGVDEIIQVAHVEREEVIPWALLYDFDLDTGVQEVGGEPAHHEVCLAALPSPDGTLAATRCRATPACELGMGDYGDPYPPGRSRETVVCPLGFWGFRHTIEMPPKAVRSRESPTPTWRRVVLGTTVAVAAGLNERLSLADEQRNALNVLTDASGRCVDLRPGASRDEVLAVLDDPDVQVVYLFCHASGAQPPPFLEFQRAGGKPGTITDTQLGLEKYAPWPAHPLVVLNGCRTVAFSPAAMSPFVKTLVETRSASAVIGTEVSVHEVLAAEVGPAIVQAFVNHDEAGTLLRTLRRRLLARHNHLGLAYTLYGVADLKLAPESA